MLILVSHDVYLCDVQCLYCLTCNSVQCFSIVYFIQMGGERGTQKSGLHKKRSRVDDGRDAEAGAGSKTGVAESSS